AALVAPGRRSRGTVPVNTPNIDTPHPIRKQKGSENGSPIVIPPGTKNPAPREQGPGPVMLPISRAECGSGAGGRDLEEQLPESDARLVSGQRIRADHGDLVRADGRRGVRDLAGRRVDAHVDRSTIQRPGDRGP